jgi:hypothetical protein
MSSRGDGKSASPSSIAKAAPTMPPLTADGARVERNVPSSLEVDEAEIQRASTDEGGVERLRAREVERGRARGGQGAVVGEDTGGGPATEGRAPFPANIAGGSRLHGGAPYPMASRLHLKIRGDRETSRTTRRAVRHPAGRGAPSLAKAEPRRCAARARSRSRRRSESSHGDTLTVDGGLGGFDADHRWARVAEEPALRETEGPKER